MVKVKVKETFSDKKDGFKIRTTGEIYEATQERANELIAKRKVEIYKEPKKAKTEE